MKLKAKQFQRVNARIEEMLDHGINPFSYYINNKKKFNIGWYLEYRDFLNYLDTVSPTWKLLWCIDDFIHMIELVYMYHNDIDNTLYSFILKKSDVRSFRVNHKDFYIEYTLYEKDHLININVVRNWNVESVSKISFPDGQASMETRSDEILMFNIIEWTMNPAKTIFSSIYNGAKEVKPCQKKT